MKPTKLERLEQLAEIEEIANGRWTMAGDNGRRARRAAPPQAREASRRKLCRRQHDAGKVERCCACGRAGPVRAVAERKRRNAPMSTIKEEGEGPLRVAATWLQMCVMGGRGGGRVTARRVGAGGGFGSLLGREFCTTCPRGTSFAGVLPIPFPWFSCSLYRTASKRKCQDDQRPAQEAAIVSKIFYRFSLKP